jgi:SAM-dependent methyltransferase
MSNTIPCNLCGVDDANVVFGPGVAQASQIVRCNRCGLMYASPRAQVADSVDIITWDPNDDGTTLMPQRFTKEKIQVTDYAKTRAFLNQLYPNRGKLLEVGSSFGFLLAEFRKDGWDVMGIEPYGAGCRFTGESHGIKVIHGVLEEADIADNTFDVVLLNHVIEHMDNPLGTLREINRVLKLNGHFVVETPRYDTLMYKLLGRRERSLSCNGHIYFFTTETLKKLYEAAGFCEVKLAYTGRSLTADRLAWNIGVMSKSNRVKCWLDQISRALKLEKMRLYLNMRDIQRVCVQKIAAVPNHHPTTAAPPVASQ